MLSRILPHLRQDRIVGGALVLAVTQLLASVAGLLRDSFLAKTFPGLDVVDVYIAAFRPSDLLFQVCIMAGFSVALVPLLAKYKVQKKSQDLSELLSGVIAVAALVFGAVALLAGLFFEHIAPYLVRFEGESLALYVRFGRMALLTNFLFVFGNAFGQYLITVQRYWVYGLTPVLYTLGTIGGTLWLSDPVLFGVSGPMVGTLIGAFTYVLIRAVAALVSGYRPVARFWHPDLTEMGILMIPRMLALGALQLQLLLFDTIASGLPAGSVTLNAYARNFQSVAVGVAGIALAQSAFSLLSQAAANKEMKRYWIYLRKGTQVLLAVTVPGAAALVLLTPVAAMLVHLTDRLDAFRICIILYALSIPFESMNHLLLRAYYAIKSSVIPAILSVSNGVIAIAVSWLLSDRYGVYALALGFTAGQTAQMLGLALLLPSTAGKAMSHRGLLLRLRSLFSRRGTR